MKKTMKKLWFRIVLVAGGLMGACPVLAEEGSPVSELEGSINRLISVMWLIPRGLGIWLLVMGIKDLATGINDHQNNQSLKGIMEIIGGGMLLFAKELVSWITGKSV